MSSDLDQLAEQLRKSTAQKQVVVATDDPTQVVNYWPIFFGCLAIAGAILIAVFFWRSGSDDDAGPDPVPTSEVISYAENAGKTFLRSMGTNSRMTGAGVRENQLKTLDDVSADAQKRKEKTLESFRRVMGDLDNQHIPEEITPENRESFADYLEAVGVGLEKAGGR